MANKGLVECALGLMGGSSKMAGSAEDLDAAYQSVLKTPNGKATYAQATGRYEKMAVKGSENSFHKKFADALGFKPSDIAMFTGRPSEVLGDDIINPVIERIETFLESGGSLAQYKREVSPFLQQYRKKVLPTLPEVKRGYFNDLMLDEIDGASTFPTDFKSLRVSQKRLKPDTPVDKVVSNVLGKLVSNNPMIALYNVFEILPKSYAIALDTVGPGQAERALMKTFADFSQATKGKFWLPVDEIPSTVYQPSEGGKFAQWLKGKTGIGNLIDLTENPLRTFAYLLGENMAPGQGRSTVERIAFSYRPGNVPSMLRNRQSAYQVQLMRFSIESLKMYGSLIKRAAGGDARAAMALAGFHAITAAQTGINSTIPKPIAMALPEEFKEQVSELEASYPGFTQMIGFDIGENVQPVGGVAIGVGGSIATTIIGGGIGKTLKAPGLFLDDPLVGALTFLEGLGGLAQGTSLPINLNTPRLLRALRQAAENNELDASGIGENILDSYNIETSE